MLDISKDEPNGDIIRLVERQDVPSEAYQAADIAYFTLIVLGNAKPLDLTKENVCRPEVRYNH
jgi:hypothetical protein